MSEPVITLTEVGKRFPSYHHLMRGLKHVVCHLPAAYRTWRRGPHQVFAGLSLEVARGESLGIIGPNGSGKSTLLGLMAGVLKPTSGRVTIRGRVSPLLELGAGFHPELTGLENVFLNGVLLGLTRAEVERRLPAILEFAELGTFIHEPVRVYSSGMLARLGFAVVAELDPEILLVDEILAVGDAAFHRKCLDKVREFRRRGVTMVFVSHALDNVREFCDRAVWLEGGGIRRMGPPDEVIAAYLAALAPAAGGAGHGA